MRRARAVWGIVVVVLFVTAACTGGSDTGTSTSSTSSGSSGSTSSSGMGSSSGDTACVNIDPASYDRACLGDGDCMLVPTGKLCTGGCGCGSTPIAKAASSKYEQDTASVDLLACPCASPGIARCVSNTCTLCALGNPAPGCPDGG